MPTTNNTITITPTNNSTSNEIINKAQAIPHANIIIPAVAITVSLCLLAGIGYCIYRCCRTRRVNVRRGERIELRLRN